METAIEQIVKLAQYLDIAELRALENALSTRRYKLQNEKDKQFAALINL